MQTLKDVLTGKVTLDIECVELLADFALYVGELKKKQLLNTPPPSAMESAFSPGEEIFPTTSYSLV